MAATGLTAVFQTGGRDPSLRNHKKWAACGRPSGVRADISTSVNNSVCSAFPIEACETDEFPSWIQCTTWLIYRWWFCGWSISLTRVQLSVKHPCSFDFKRHYTQANCCQVALRPLFEQRETLKALLRLTCSAHDPRVTVWSIIQPWWGVSHNPNTKEMSVNHIARLISSLLFFPLTLHFDLLNSLHVKSLKIRASPQAGFVISCSIHRTEAVPPFCFYTQLSFNICVMCVGSCNGFFQI